MRRLFSGPVLLLLLHLIPAMPHSHHHQLLLRRNGQAEDFFLRMPSITRAFSPLKKVARFTYLEATLTTYRIFTRVRGFSLVLQHHRGELWLASVYASPRELRGNGVKYTLPPVPHTVKDHYFNFSGGLQRVGDRPLKLLVGDDSQARQSGGDPSLLLHSYSERTSQQPWILWQPLRWENMAWPHLLEASSQ